MNQFPHSSQIVRLRHRICDNRTRHLLQTIFPAESTDKRLSTLLACISFLTKLMLLLESLVKETTFQTVYERNTSPQYDFFHAYLDFLRFTTLLARFHSPVSCYMHTQTFCLSKQFPTLLTCIWLLSISSSFMHPQIVCSNR